MKQSKQTQKKPVKMWQIILIALVLGTFTGIALSYAGGTAVGWIATLCALFSFLGDLFIRMIRMVVVPLVFLSIVSAIIDLKDIRRLKNIGVKTLLFFTFTSSISIIIGLVLASFIKPGAGLNLTDMEITSVEVSSFPNIYDTLLDIVPLNIFEAFVNGSMLQIIFFSVFLGIAVILLGEKGEPIGKAFKLGASVMYKIIDLIVYYIPVGVFGLMANAMAEYGTSILGNILKFILVDYMAASLQVLLVYVPLLLFVAKINPIKFAKIAFESWLVAFSTCTSSASLPISMKNAESKMGISKDISSFVLPLGATANMDGTGIFFGLVVVFAAQIAGVELTLMQMASLVLEATLLSIGCAAVPQIGLVIGTSMITSMGLPVEVIGLVAGVYRIVDQIHTATNATGDLVIAACVAKTEGQISPQSPILLQENVEQ